MRKLIAIFLIWHSLLIAGLPIQGDFLGPSEQLIKRHKWKHIEKRMQSVQIPDKYFPLFKSIAENENWGHIGYHGATQQFRIYQDIIKFTVEEILHIPLRADFQFLRVPGDPDLHLSTIDAFFEFWGNYVNNKIGIRKKQLLSLNYGIYSNCNVVGSSSILFFIEGRSITDADFEELLYPFYKGLGIPTKELKKIFKLAGQYLTRKEGILLAIADHSHLNHRNNEAYNFADTQCYPSKGRGHRLGTRLLSEEYQCMMSEEFIARKADVAPHMRLLLNNANTVNPFSDLSIQRWDFYDTETIALYESEMRSYIRNLQNDPIKTADYREALLEMWM